MFQSWREETSNIIIIEALERDAHFMHNARAAFRVLIRLTLIYYRHLLNRIKRCLYIGEDCRKKWKLIKTIFGYCLQFIPWSPKNSRETIGRQVCDQ